MDTDTKIDEILKQLVTNVGGNQFALDGESITYTQARLKDDGFIAESKAAFSALIREAETKRELAGRRTELQMLKDGNEHSDYTKAEFELLINSRLAALNAEERRLEL